MSRGLLSQLSPAELETFLDQPALTPPNGVIPQFQNRPNKNALCITVESICFTATTIAVLVRAYTVVFKEKKVKLEDSELPNTFSDKHGRVLIQYSPGLCRICAFHSPVFNMINSQLLTCIRIGGIRHIC